MNEQDISRLNDKVKNSYGVDLFATARKALGYTGMELVETNVPAPGQTYEEKRADPEGLSRFVILFSLCLSLVFLFTRRG